MSDTADLVPARIKPEDALKERAERHVHGTRLLFPFSVGLGLLFVAKRHGFSLVEALGATTGRFDVEDADVPFTAAEAIDSEDVKTVVEAVHLADALRRNARLRTADEALPRTAYPTQAF